MYTSPLRLRPFGPKVKKLLLLGMGSVPGARAGAHWTVVLEVASRHSRLALACNPLVLVGWGHIPTMQRHWNRRATSRCHVGAGLCERGIERRVWHCLLGVLQTTNAIIPRKGKDGVEVSAVVVR